MRQPIQVSHEKHQYQVIWRKKDGVKNWNHYVAAETPEDAKQEARNLLAYDSVRHADEVGPTASWEIAEVNTL